MSNKIEWRDIPGYEGRYRISDDGRVFSLVRKRELSTRIGGWGYLQVNIGGRIKPKNALVHRLVASAFLGEQPSHIHVHHKDENKLNNQVDNLEYLPLRYHRSMHAIDKHKRGILGSGGFKKGYDPRRKKRHQRQT